MSSEFIRRGTAPTTLAFGSIDLLFGALDIKTYAMARLRSAYRKSAKRYMPKRWFDRLPHTHNALEDPIEQGALFCNMLASSLGDKPT